MKRWLMVFLFMLVLGLQGPPSSVAAASPAAATPADCPTAGENHETAAHTCCTDTGSHTSCCTSAVVNAVGPTLSSGQLPRHGRPPQGSLVRTTIFSSRGESPLIRPPIF